MADNVTRFPGTGDLPECPVSVERQTGYCEHPAIRLVEHDRAVICAKCGATLDAFEYLRGQAFAIRRGWELYRQVKYRVEELDKKREALVKDVKRLGAQVRRLKAKEPAPVDFRKPL